MSSARELFLQATGHGIPRIGDKEALRLFTQAAGKWRDSGQYLNAGYAMSQAIYAAWGNGERVNACLNAALLDFRNCVSTEPAQSHEGLAAICEWIHQLRYIDDRTVLA
jgi:hypothetical protein